jgi:glycosyltransferase involved in cell wall biosynthesis
MIRILHLAAGNLYGGIERVLVTLAECREQCRSMVPEFALCFEGRLAGELRRTGVPVHMLPAMRASRPLTVLRARQKLRALVGERHFDVAICHSAWSHALLSPVCRRLRIPLVFWMHDTVTSRGWEEHVARWTPPDLVIANSHFTSEGVKRLYPRCAAEILYYPVKPAGEDPIDRAAVRREFDTPVSARVIVQVSRMEKWKGHTLQLEALRELADLPGWIYWVVGGPQRPSEHAYFEDLRQLAHQYQLSPRIRFVGSRGDVNRLLAAADIFCQPNTGPEPFGIVFVEALLAGLPVVSTAIGGVLEIVDRSCGILVEPDQPRALASALRTLVADGGMCRGLSSAGPRRARLLCDPHVQMEKMAELLAQRLPSVNDSVNTFQSLESHF